MAVRRRGGFAGMQRYAHRAVARGGLEQRDARFRRALRLVHVRVAAHAVHCEREEHGPHEHEAAKGMAAESGRGHESG